MFIVDSLINITITVSRQKFEMLSKSLIISSMTKIQGANEL